MIMVDPSKSGAILIAEERARQVAVEGWNAEHDDAHTDGSLALAAVCYATPTPLFVMDERSNGYRFIDPWPDSWDEDYDKRLEYGDNQRVSSNSPAHPDTLTEEERLDLLIKAGALIAAEIDRRIRAEETRKHKLAEADDIPW